MMVYAMMVVCTKQGATGDASEGLSTEAWSRHGHWRIPFFMKSVAGSAPGSGDKHTFSDAIVVEARTTTVQRTIEADQTRVQFGQLAVGQVSTSERTARQQTTSNRQNHNLTHTVTHFRTHFRTHTHTCSLH